MSTTHRRSLRRRRLRAEDLSQPVARPKRRLPLAASGGMVVLGLVWAAPWLASLDLVRDRVLAWASEEVDGTIACESLSLGWFSPVVARHVTLRDRQGQPIATLPEIVGDRGLWRLVWNPSRLGKFRLDRPTLTLVVDERTTNLEEFLAPLWRRNDDSSQLVAAEIELNDGRVTIDDRPRNAQWQIDDLALLARLPGDPREPLWGQLSAEVRGQREHGNVRAEFELASLSGEKGRLEARTEGLPLAVVSGLARRWQRELELGGRVDSQLHCEWTTGDDKQPRRTIEGVVETSDLMVAGPFAKGDVLRVDRLKFPCRAVWTADQLDVEQAALECDFADASYRGHLDLKRGLSSALARGRYALAGRIDLAALARALPATLRIREGTEIAKGEIEIELACEPISDAHRWHGRIETENLVAFDQGREITWEKPIHATFEGRQTDDGPIIDQLVCDSSFLELEASGTPDWLSVSASYDLDQLSRELGRFVDLTDVQLTGQGWSHMTWKRGPRSTFTAGAEMQLRNLQLVLPGARQWHEDQLVLFGEVNGLLADREIRRVDSAVFEVKSATGQMQVELVKPVHGLDRRQPWPLAVALDTQLAGWLPRIEALWGALPQYDLAGRARATLDGSYSADQVVLESAIVELEGFEARAPGVAIREPQARCTAQSGLYRAERSHLELASLVWKSPGLSLDVRDLDVERDPAAGRRAAGRVAFAGDLARFQTWLADPQAPPSYRLSGRLAGEAQLARRGEVTTASLQSAVEQLLYEGPSGQPWREAHVQIAGNGQYDSQADRLALERFEVASNAARLKAAGRIERFSHQRQLVLEGDLDYDLAQLQTVIARYLGEGFRVAGRQRHPFRLAGPIGGLEPRSAEAVQVAAADRRWLGELKGSTSAGWKWIDAYGFVLGEAQTPLLLEGGLLAVEALELPASRGRLRLAPRLRLTSEPMELLHPAGRVVDRVAITPAMCDQGLKYIAPVLAGVTDASGSFSLDVEKCRLPVGQPAQGDLTGKLQVHTIEISAGPLVRELATLLGRSTSVRLARESTVAFRMVDGRIYHRDLELVFPDVTVRTHGSVGLDRTLALVAQMPVPKKWIGGNALGTALANQVIELPIGGTVDSPRLDQQALEQASARFLKRSAENLLIDGLNRQLDRLLGPK